jgi:hypothetical protein
VMATAARSVRPPSRLSLCLPHRYLLLIRGLITRH